MDWSSQNVVAVALAPQGELAFDMSRQSYANQRTSGPELVLWTPIELIVKTGSSKSIKYAGGTGLCVFSDVRFVHSAHPITILKCIPDFEFAPPVGPALGFGAYSCIAVTSALEINYWCFGGDLKLQRKQIKISGIAASEEVQQAALVPIQVVDVQVDAFVSDVKIAHTSFISLEPEETVARIHAIDSSRIAVVAHRTDEIGEQQHIVTLWEQRQPDTADDAMVQDVGLQVTSASMLRDSQWQPKLTFCVEQAISWRLTAKRVFFESHITSLGSMLQLSDAQEEGALIVGLRNGSIQYRSLVNLEELSAMHRLLFRDVALDPDQIPGDAAARNPPTPGSLFRSLGGGISGAYASSLGGAGAGAGGQINKLGNEGAQSSIIGIKPNTGAKDAASREMSPEQSLRDIGAGIDAAFSSMHTDPTSGAPGTDFDEPSTAAEGNLDEIFGTMTGATPDASGVLEGVTSGGLAIGGGLLGQMQGIQSQPSGARQQSPASLPRFPVRLLVSPNGLHILAQMVSQDPRDATHIMGAHMLVQSHVRPGIAQLANDSARVAHAVADAMLAAILSGRAIDDYLVLIHALSLNADERRELMLIPESRILMPNGFEYKNTRSMMRLRSIQDMLMASFANPGAAQDSIGLLYLSPASFSESFALPNSMIFQKESIHHLVPHALWILEFCAFLARHMYIHCNVRTRPAMELPLMLRSDQWVMLLHGPTRRTLLQCLLLIRALRFNLAQILAATVAPKGRSNARVNSVVAYIRSIDNVLAVGRIRIEAFAAFLCELDQLAQAEHAKHAPAALADDQLEMVVAASLPPLHQPLAAPLFDLFKQHVYQLFEWPTAASLSAMPPYLAGLLDSKAGPDTKAKLSALVMFTPGQFDRLELEPIEFALSIPRSRSGALLAMAGLPPLPPATSQQQPPQQSAIGQGALTAARRDSMSDRDMPIISSFDVVTGQHLRFSQMIRQCMRCLHFSTPEPATPKALTVLLDGPKSVSQIQAIDALSRIPVWSGYYGGCCPCGGRWRLLP
nr:hypothetical protein HK105_007138 [Polyrhizophydium stewartii]